MGCPSVCDVTDSTSVYLEEMTGWRHDVSTQTKARWTKRDFSLLPLCYCWTILMRNTIQSGQQEAGDRECGQVSCCLTGSHEERDLHNDVSTVQYRDTPQYITSRSWKARTADRGSCMHACIHDCFSNVYNFTGSEAWCAMLHFQIHWTMVLTLHFRKIYLNIFHN